MLNLQLFNEEQSEVTETTNVGKEEVTTPVESKELKESKPFATFPDEATFMKRINREGRKQMQDTLKELGLNDINALKGLVEEVNQRKEAEMTELDKLQNTVAQLTKDNEKYKKEYESIKVRTQAEKEALKLGVDPIKMDYFMKMVNLSDISEPEDIVNEFNKVLDVMPEFKTVKKQSLPNKSGIDYKDGGKDKANSKPPLTDELIRNMSVDEVSQRLDEINEFLSNK